MIGLSSVIGRPVLSLATSCIIGSVSDVYFDANCKKAVYFYIQQPLKNESALLPIESASSVSDAVIVGNESALVALGNETYKRGLKNMPVYTQTGALKGTLSDVLFTPAGKVAKLVCGDWEFTPSSISSIGDVILLKNAVKPVANRKKRKALIPRPETDYPVYILDGDRDKSTAIPIGFASVRKRRRTARANGNYSTGFRATVRLLFRFRGATCSRSRPIRRQPRARAVKRSVQNDSRRLGGVFLRRGLAHADKSHMRL